MSVSEVVNAYVAYTTGELILLARDPAGKLRMNRQRAQYSSFHHLSDVSVDARRWVESSSNPATVGASTEGEFLRVEWRDGKWRSYGLENEQSPLAKIPSFEGDVHPVKRYMVDSGARVQAPRFCFVDLETDSRVSFARARAGESRVLCYAVVGEDEGVVSAEVLDEETDDSERALLTKLAAALEPYDQVCAWNGDRFDFLVLNGGRERGKERTPGRFERVGVRFNHRRLLWLDQMQAFIRMNRAVADSGDMKSSYALQAIATEVVGEGKNDFDASKTYEEWAAGGERRACLLDYCVQDTKLLAKIERKTGYLGIFSAVADASGVLPDSRGLMPSGQVDTFMLRLGSRAGLRFRTHTYGGAEEHDKFKGAYRVKPKWKGITTDVHVCDFTRLYPSIMVTWNMSPETKVEGSWASNPLAEDPAPGVCRAPGTGVRFSTARVGILPTAVLEAVRLRQQWVDVKASCAPGTPEWEDADRRSSGYKVFGLSMYGVIGSTSSRFFDRELAESITQTGAFLIRYVADGLAARGWDPGYIDTDSTFVRGCTDGDFRTHVARLNAEDFPRIARESGTVTCDVSLAYEKKFAKIVFVSSLRYIGKFAHYKGKVPKEGSKPEIKGIEYKRGDTAMLARRLQEKIIRLIVGDWSEPFDPPTEDVERYRALIVEYREHVLRDPDLPLSEVVASNSLAKGLNGYAEKVKVDGTKQEGPMHLRVARQLAERGAEVDEGTKIQYVLVDKGGKKPVPIPAADYEPGVTNVDRYYLWENRIYPAAERLLVAAFPHENWASYEKARPAKRAPLKGGAGPGQGALFADVVPVGSTVPIARVIRPIVPAMRRSRASIATEEYAIRLTAAGAYGRLDALKALLLRYPGTRPAVVEIETPTSAGVATVKINTGISVAGTASLAADIAALLAAAFAPT